MGATQIRIHTSDIPPVAAHSLAVTFLDACMKFYDDPSNVKAFEEWQRKKEAKTCLK